jgi:hypothetical protein
MDSAYVNVKSIYLPVAVRIYHGQKKQIFLEGGIFGQLYFRGKISGIRNYHSLPQIYNGYYVENRSYKAGTNYGILLAYGIKLPYKNHFLFFKAEGKIGLYPIISSNLWLDNYLNEIPYRSYLSLTFGYKL